jgi:hypothetical protein
MFKKIVFALMLFMIALSACAPGASPAPDSFEREVIGEGVAPGAPAFGEPAPAEESGAFDTDQSFQGQTGEPAERLVIKNATLEIVVDAPEKSMEAIGQLAESFGGYVVSANLSQTFLADGREVPQASITVRVPAERLDEALARIEEESDRLPLNKNIQSQDITSDYTDLQSRLRNLEAAEEQLMEIMGSATRTEDVLNVFNQLTSVREQIEIVKGQIQYYDQSVALSAISVVLIANEAVQPISIGGWEPVGVVKDAVEALIQGLQVLVSALIWIGLFVLPILVVIILPIYIVVRLVIRARKQRKERSAPPATT